MAAKKKTSTYKIDKHIDLFMDLVDKDAIKVSKEIKALIGHIRWCFENEDIYVDHELADKYLALAKYFPYEQVFPWQEFVIALHDCTFDKNTKMPRWPDLFCMIGRGAGKDGTIALESTALASPYNGIHGYDVDICANNEEQALRPVLDIVEAFDSAAASDKKKLKKYTANVTGVVVDGKGFGQALVKKPAFGPWSVTVR